MMKILAGPCDENLQSYMTFLSLVDGQNSSNYLEMFFSHVHTRLLHKFFCLPLDLFMSKIYLNWAGVYWKIIALMAMLMLFTDMFHTASLVKPGAWEGPGQGDTLRRSIISSTRVNEDLFSFARCNKRDFIYVSLKTCNTR